ncbi:hypothetical protein [uncultured Mediterranean phage uvMED]|nr:hypothetical protein [uncultured Mediterranean phage uvMED]BAR22182.1 hypothetical protein [uncultured Mediterranean phage uvMED]BAR22211.1 hypothetical protein [uncultured Mediterranean phage uvMED]BAR22277.1 hypothetical protein [uncultured Mediterranean phage uvMED]BAR22297.1 hypothetical protein [uncultured Mediterranean phage uvMED]
MPKPAKFSNGKKLSDEEYEKLLEVQKARGLSAAVVKTLKTKAKNSNFSFVQLKTVYIRGQKAYLSGGKKNVPMAAWAMSRVNSFLQGGEARKADADILKKTDINEQVKNLIRRIKKAKDIESVKTTFDKIHKIIDKENNLLKQNYINELYEIEKKYETELKNQIYNKPDTYKETYTTGVPEKILNIKQQEKSMLESGHLRPLLEKYSMILPSEVREKLKEGTLIFNISANEMQIVDANNKAKVVGTIENPNSKEWVGGLVDKDGNKEEIRAINSTFKPADVQKNYKYIQGLSTAEKAFYFKYVSPIGYYAWHKVASNYITNYKNSSQEKRFKVFSSPAYYLTDELATAFINTPVKNLKFDEEPKIVNNSFFVFQSTGLNNVQYVFVDCVYKKGFVYLHISYDKNYYGFSGQSIKFAWNNLSNFKKTDGIKKTDELVENQFNIIVNMILLMNQQPDIEVEYMPPSITIPVQRGFSKPEVFKPRPITWVGKEFSKRIVKIYPNTDDLLPKQPGIPKRSHWRRGHWHTVLQGPKREQRKMKWYEPVFIKGKRLTSVDC